MAKENILLSERFPIFLPNRLAGEVSDEAVAGGVVDEMVSRTLSHHITTTPLDEEDCDGDGRRLQTDRSWYEPSAGNSYLMQKPYFCNVILSQECGVNYDQFVKATF